jgi:hypothetical protein
MAGMLAAKCLTILAVVPCYTVLVTTRCKVTRCNMNNA